MKNFINLNLFLALVATMTMSAQAAKYGVGCTSRVDDMEINGQKLKDGHWVVFESDVPAPASDSKEDMEKFDDDRFKLLRRADKLCSAIGSSDPAHPLPIEEMKNHPDAATKKGVIVIPLVYKK